MNRNDKRVAGFSITWIAQLGIPFGSPGITLHKGLNLVNVISFRNN